jgi:phosphopantetheinyl transferase (holo-ACP synthase)
MIGNDLVDLAAAKRESNWRRKGFLEKIFTEAERQLIRNASKPDIVVWILWSMKESGYKIQHRQNGIRRFNPKSFACGIHHISENEASGIVCFQDLVYYSESKISSEFIHTVCRNPAYQEKQLFIRFANDCERVEKRNFISRNELGIPYFKNENRTNDLVSISHHGRYCSYLSTFKLG